MATLKDIAKEAGVSIMTVSNVINGNHSKVSQETIQLVKEIAKKMNYAPNLNARSLSKRSSKMIAVFVTTYLTSTNIFKDPYISQLFGEIETKIRQAGYYAIIRTVQSSDNVSDILQNWNVDGAIFLTWESEETMNTLIEHSKCPIVFIDSYNSTNPNALMVGVNDYKGGYIATKYLISKGHRKIAFAGCYSEGNAIIAKRFQGYLDAHKDAGFESLNSNLINTYTRYEDGIKLGRDLANGRYDVTAVFATADLFAVGIIEGARLNGLIVPNDLSVIGFDNLELCSFVSPKLTTISQDVAKKADLTVHLLLDAIAQKEIESKNLTCDVELVIRQTVQDLQSARNVNSMNDYIR